MTGIKTPSTLGGGRKEPTIRSLAKPRLSEEEKGTYIRRDSIEAQWDDRQIFYSWTYRGSQKQMNQNERGEEYTICKCGRHIKT